MEEVIEEKNETKEETVNRVKNNKEFLLIIEDHDLKKIIMLLRLEMEKRGWLWLINIYLN